MQAINSRLRCTRESAEFRAQAEQMGRYLLDWLKNSARAADPRMPTVAALSSAPRRATACWLFPWGWAENMSQAAMKAVPLSQAAAQRLLSRLAAELPGVVDAAMVLPAEDRQAYSPMLATLIAKHEAQYSRLFRS